jgi:hypothetical protein
MINTFTNGLAAPAQKRGFQTSELMGNSSEAFAENFNKYSGSFKAIQNDKTRTKAEKAVLLSKLGERANSHLLSDFESVANSHLSRSISANAEREAYLAPTDRAVALELAKHLKSAKADDIHKLVRGNQQYAEALNSMPSGYFGMSEDTVDSISNLSISQNKPELYAKFKQLGLDQKQLDNMKTFVTDAKRALAANIDQDALKTRVEDI